MQEENDDILSFLDQSIERSKRLCATADSENEIPVQLREYLAVPSVDRVAHPNPLCIWGIIKNEYPDVWKVAKKILPIAATSVPCERLFSHAGLIANQSRSQLSPEHLSMLVFMRSLDEDVWMDAA